ncbi:MAG TPA: thioredoxin [Actinomycetota bacterium]|nr:thioredoxin [Actinomycetota bacterium]
MPVIELDAATFRRHVLESTTPVVVDFYADWCGPCKQVAPVVEALAAEWEDEVTFAKLDIDASPEVAAAFNIRSIPAIILFEDGAPKAWSLGAKPGYLLERELGLAKRKRDKARGEKRSWWRR